MLAKTYHAVITRRSAAGLCRTAIPSTPGSVLPPPFVEDGPPPAPTEGGLPGSIVGPVLEVGVMQGRLEGVCLGALQGEPGLKSSSARVPPQDGSYTSSAPPPSECEQKHHTLTSVEGRLM